MQLAKNHSEEHSYEASHPSDPHNQVHISTPSHNMSFRRLLFLLTSLLLTLCSRSRSFPLFPPLFFPFTPALSSLAGGLVGAGWYSWICEYGDFAWLLGVAECVANSGCCISLVGLNGCSNLDTDAASGLHRSPAVCGVSHAASTQHKAVSTKQLNMLEASCDGWCNISCSLYLQCLAVLIP